MIARSSHTCRWCAPGRPTIPPRPRRMENPLLSPRLGPVPPLPVVRYPGRDWYVFHGYPRRFRGLLPVSPPPSPPPARKLVGKVVFSLLPVLLYPLFFRWGAFLYPRLRLAAGAIRPPRPSSFFPELLLVVLAAASVAVLQALFALIFFRKGRKDRSPDGFRWDEASLAGGLLAAGVYGVLRGFQYRPDEFLFLPPFALATAIFFWVLVAVTVLFGSRKRGKTDTPGPIRTADTRFRKPVLYPSELQGREVVRHCLG